MKTRIKIQTIIYITSIMNLTISAQTAHPVRNIARSAPTEIDAVYTNPAGLIKLFDGFHFSINNSSIFQQNTIQSDYTPYMGNGGVGNKNFKSQTNSMLIPNLLAAYKKERWAFSLGLEVSSTNKLKFSEGIPSYESSIANVPVMLTSTGIPTTQYTLKSSIEKELITYNVQLGISYSFNKKISVYGGLRFNQINNQYNSFIKDIRINPVDPFVNLSGEMMLATDYFNAVSESARNTAIALNPFIETGVGSYTLTQLVGSGRISQEMANRLTVGLGNSENVHQMTIESIQTAYIAKAETNMQNSTQLLDKYQDASQSGWGISPIIGINFSQDKLNVGVKYELKNSIKLKNKTQRDDIGNYPDGAKVPNDLPALFTIGASYQLNPKVQACIAYHHIFETKNNQQEFIPNTNQYLAGLEYKLNDKFLLSIGGQISRPEIIDEYQSEFNNHQNSYTIAGGLAYNVSEKMRLNVGCQYINYADYTKESANPRIDEFSKTKTVIALGIDYHF